MLGLPLKFAGFGGGVDKGELAAKKPSSANGGGATGGRSGSPDQPAVPLPPESIARQRKLRHVTQVAVRGFGPEATHPGGYVLEIVAVVGSGAGEVVLERSDALYSRNPSWTPGVNGVQKGRNLTTFMVRAVSAKDASVFWSSVVILSTLVEFCDDLETSPSLPPSCTPLVRVGTKWHTMPSAKAGQPPTACTASATKPRRNATPKQLLASDICSAGDRISSMLERLRTLQGQTKDICDSMNTFLAQSEHLQARREQRELRKQRIVRLRREVSRRRRGVAELRSRFDATRMQQTLQEERLEVRRKEMREVAQVIPSLDAVYADFRLLWRQLRCRQMRMLHEVSEIYPVEATGKCRTIRRLFVGSMDALNRQDLREEENVSTALGYLAHLVATIASILEVPLRINVHQAGCSRCSVSDPHETLGLHTAKEWPLFYGRGGEKGRFINAVKLLREGFHQLLYSRGYFDDKLLQPSGNLLECVELILRNELHQPADLTGTANASPT